MSALQSLDQSPSLIVARYGRRYDRTKVCNFGQTSSKQLLFTDLTMSERNTAKRARRYDRFSLQFQSNRSVLIGILPI